MRNSIIFCIGIITLLYSPSFSQGYNLTSDDIILLKHNNFSKETLQKLSAASELMISVDEIIKLKNANITEETILKMATKEKLENDIKIEEQTEAEQFRVYESKKKSSVLAMTCSCLLPSSGHAYAGNWKRGLLITAGRSVFFALIVYDAISGEDETKCSRTFTNGVYTQTCVLEENNPSALGVIGLLGYLSMTISEMIDASRQVKKYNNELYQKIMGEDTGMSFNWVPIKTMGGDYTLGMQISYSF